MMHRKIKTFFTAKGAQKQPPIIADQDKVQKTLFLSVVIMSFLACLCLTGVNLVAKSAQNWISQISREATIQVLPVDGYQMDTQLHKALSLMKNSPFVQRAHIVSEEETKKLLEPWLGENFSLADLPLPRLIVVHFQEGATPDLKALAKQVQTQVKGANFDNHRLWAKHLANIAHSLVLAGLLLLLLVIIATLLTVIFATKTALSTNSETVEVLHFLGADRSFIAKEFDRCFFGTALRGASLGAIGAFLCSCLFTSLWGNNFDPIVSGIMEAFLGSISLSSKNFIETLTLVAIITLSAVITSRLTILKQLSAIDRRNSKY